MLINFTLIRVARTDDGVFGVLLKGSKPFAVTLEPEDKNNQRNISCIPAGSYYCEPFDSPRFGWTYRVMDVPERDYILFHAGNTEGDTEGCILVAESFGELRGKSAILDSKKGFSEFRDKAGGNRITLTILWAFSN